MRVSPARIAAAEALRRLGHAIVGHTVDDELLARIARAAEGLLPEIEAGTPRARDVDYLKRSVFANAHPPEGSTIAHFPDCIVSGAANPMGVGIAVHRQGDEAVARVTLGAAFEGAPQRAHGGIVAAIFDDVMGYVLVMHGTPAYTGRLTISYMHPTPVAEELEFRARLVDRVRRKLTIESEAYDAAGEKVTKATGIFVTIPPERLGLPPAPTT